MEAFDIIIMAVGALLIVIGVVLFAAGGVKGGGQSNQVEGFGIKLNVSNPSIILIVLGIGLLLVPRVLPKPGQEAATRSAQAGGNALSEQSRTAEAVPEESPSGAESISAPPEPAAEAAQQQAAATLPQATEIYTGSGVFLPNGVWQLVDYEEDGVDLSGSVQASIYFEPQSTSQAAWSADFVVVDGWGNMANLRYMGLISGAGEDHSIAITASNDPNFYTEGPGPLNLWMEDGGLLHMEYSHNGSDILIHWTQ